MPGFDYSLYKDAVENTGEVIDDIGLLQKYNNNYQRLIIDALEGKIEFKGMKQCFDSATIKNSMESRQGQATLYNAYIIGLMSAPKLIDWAEKYSMVQSIPLQ
ncbi:MAG: hypothetical protein MJ193_01200 [Clostridia bacterium]|nr:hypothetical protein [Clostridia bacterium]